MPFSFLKKRRIGEEKLQGKNELIRGGKFRRTINGKPETSNKFVRHSEIRRSLDNHPLTLQCYQDCIQEKGKILRQNEYWKARAKSKNFQDGGQASSSDVQLHNYYPQNSICHGQELMQVDEQCTMDEDEIENREQPLNKNDIIKTMKDKGSAAERQCRCIVEETTREEFLKKLLVKIDALEREKMLQEKEHAEKCAQLEQKLGYQEQQCGRYRNALLNEKKKTNKLNKMISMIRQLGNNNEKDSKKIKKILTSIERQRMSIARISTGIGVLGEALLTARSHVNKDFAEIPDSFKTIINNLKRKFAKPMLSALVAKLGLSPELSEELRTRTIHEGLWLVISAWVQKSSEQEGLLSEFEQACLDVGVNFEVAPMPVQHRQAFCRCKQLLLENGDAVFIAPYMELEAPFPSCVEGYLDTKTRFEGMQRLIDLVPINGENALPILIRALKKSNYEFLATRLEETIHEIEQGFLPGYPGPPAHMSAQPTCISFPQSHLSFPTFPIENKPMPVVDVLNEFPHEGQSKKADELYRTVKQIDATTLHIGMQMSKLESIFLECPMLSNE